MKKIRILFVIDHIYHIGGGTEGQLSCLINGLDRDEFDVHLAALRYSSWIDTDCFKCPKLILGIGSLKKPDTWRKVRHLSAFIRNQRFDIVQTYFPDSNLVGVIAARWGRAGRVVSAQRNLGYDLNRTRLFALRRVSRWVDRYLVNCQAVGESLILRLGIPRDKIDIVHNGVDYERFEKVDDDVRADLKRRLGIQNGDLVVGLMSNFRPVKNIDGFLRAAAEVSVSFPKARFLIIGGGEPGEAQRLKQLSHGLNIGQKVMWTGMVEDVIPYLSLLDLGVLCSFSEGLSNTILEYMASGLPVVASSVGGNAELIVEGTGGFLISPDDSRALSKKTLLLLGDPGLRKRMGRTNQRIVQERFSLRQAT
ncbi:MAG: glycosyltransferase family 4 protein, partial [Candidatus Eisenbacteria bacterium]